MFLVNWSFNLSTHDYKRTSPLFSLQVIRQESQMISKWRLDAGAVLPLVFMQTAGKHASMQMHQWLYSRMFSTWQFVQLQYHMDKHVTLPLGLCSVNGYYTCLCARTYWSMVNKQENVCFVPRNTARRPHKHHRGGKSSFFPTVRLTGGRVSWQASI